jgi:P pilus assembly chaperone PapD
MKKIFIISLLLFTSLMYVSAQKQAEIKFDKISYDFGTFSESTPIQETVFTFTNVGDAPLVINQAVASCGCTVPSYTKAPIKPGQKGQIKVTYNGKGKFPGHFKKSITIRTNGVTEMTRLYIEGVMKEATN